MMASTKQFDQTATFFNPQTIHNLAQENDKQKQRFRYLQFKKYNQQVLVANNNKKDYLEVKGIQYQKSSVPSTSDTNTKNQYEHFDQNFIRRLNSKPTTPQSDDLLSTPPQKPARIMRRKKIQKSEELYQPPRIQSCIMNQRENQQDYKEISFGDKFNEIQASSDFKSSQDTNNTQERKQLFHRQLSYQGISQMQNVQASPPQKKNFQLPDIFLSSSKKSRIIPLERSKRASSLGFRIQSSKQISTKREIQETPPQKKIYNKKEEELPIIKAKPFLQRKPQVKIINRIFSGY